MELQRRFFEAPRQSFFLFGPRGTGKSTWLGHALPDALFVDLLQPDTARELTASPERLRDLVRGAPDPDLMGVTAAILVGGLGTRLRPAVADRPKALAEVGGRPFLHYVLTQLAQVGVRRVVLCSGYLGEQIEVAFGQSYLGVQLAYSREPTPLGTAGALRHALPLIDTESVLVMNGDSFCTVDLRAVWQHHRERNALATIVVCEVPDVKRFGRVELSVELSTEDRLLGFAEKNKDEGPGWVNAGVYVLSRALLLAIPEGTAVSLEAEMIPTWARREGVYGYRSRGSFHDIGTPDAYRAAVSFLTAEALA